DLLEHETAVATLRAQALQIGGETPDMAVILARRVLAHDESRIAAMKRGVGHVHRIVGERFGPRIVRLGREANDALAIDIGAQRRGLSNEPIDAQMRLAPIDEKGPAEIALHHDILAPDNAAELGGDDDPLPARAVLRLGDEE